MDQEKITALFETYIRKLRITPAWDVRLEFVEDPSWTKTGDFKIDCDDRKAILLLNAGNPNQENLEEIIIHELMHIKMYPLDQVTESLIANCFEEGSAASNFAYLCDSGADRRGAGEVLFAGVWGKQGVFLWTVQQTKVLS